MAKISELKNGDRVWLLTEEIKEIGTIRKVGSLCLMDLFDETGRRRGVIPLTLSDKVDLANDDGSPQETLNKTPIESEAVVGKVKSKKYQVGDHIRFRQGKFIWKGTIIQMVNINDYQVYYDVGGGFCIRTEQQIVGKVNE